MIPMRMKPVVKEVHSKYQKHLIPFPFTLITEPNICTTPEGKSQAEESENNAHQQPKIPSWFQHQIPS